MGFSWSLNQVKAQGMMGDFVFMAIVQAGAIILQHAGRKKREKGTKGRKNWDTQSSTAAKSAMMGFFYFPWCCKKKRLPLAIRYAHV